MFANTEEIKKLLIKNNYFVSVSCFDYAINKAYSKFPARKSLPFSEEALYEYSWSVDREEAVIDFKKNNKNFDTISCRKYAIKEIIFSSVLAISKKINYQESLIGFYYNDEAVNHEDFSKKCFSIDMTEEEQNKSDMLTIFSAVSRLDDFETIGEYQDSEEDEEIIDSLNKIQQVYFKHLAIDV